MKFNKKAHLLNWRNDELNREEYFLIDTPSELHKLYKDIKDRYSISQYITGSANAKALVESPRNFTIFRQIKETGDE